MELSKKEAERIIAEEKVRFDARQEWMKGSGHGCCHRRGGFWSGLLVGLAIWAASSMICRHHMWCGSGSYGCPPSQCMGSTPQDGANGK